MNFSTLQFSFQKDQQDILFTEQLPIETMENPVSCWRPGAWADEESHEIQHYQFSTSLYGILNKALEDNDQWAMPNQNKTKKIRPSSPSQFSIFYVTFLTHFWYRQYSLHSFEYAWFSSISQFWQGECCELIETKHLTVSLLCLITGKNCLTLEESQGCGVFSLHGIFLKSQASGRFSWEQLKQHPSHEIFL